MIKAVIFDCFGVVISDALQVINDELRVRNPKGAEELTDLIRAANRGMIDPIESSQRAAKILDIDVSTYRQQIRDGEVKDQRVLDFIMTIKPEYKTAMLSNISATGLRKRFTPEELEVHFDVVISSGEIRYAKPDAEAYLITAERLGVEPAECIFIDDRVDFCTAAEEQGMQAIWYQSFEQFKAAIAPLLPTTKQG